MSIDPFEQALQTISSLPSTRPDPSTFRRRRRRRRATTAAASGGLAATLVVLGVLAATSVAPAPRDGPSIGVAADAGGSAAVAEPHSSYRILVASAEAEYSTVGLTLLERNVELGPVAPGTYGFEVYLRADRETTVESIGFHGTAGVGSSMCGTDAEDEHVCDEPDRSVAGDGWILTPGEEVPVSFFVDTEVVRLGADLLMATVTTTSGTVEVPVSLSVSATDDPPEDAPGEPVEVRDQPR